MTASLLLAALGHPSPSSVAGGGEVAAASAVAWLEDAAVRALPAGDRGPLRDVESPAWPATFEQARGARERRHATRVCACSRKREVSARRAHAAASVSSRLTRLSPSTCVRLSAPCGRRRASPPSTGCSATRWGWCTTTMVRARRLSQAAGGRYPYLTRLSRARASRSTLAAAAYAPPADGAVPAEADAEALEDGARRARDTGRRLATLFSPPLTPAAPRS